MWRLSTLFLLGAFFNSASASCIETTPIAQLDLMKMEGVWYEWASFGGYSLFESHSCHISKFYIGPDRKSAAFIHDILESDDANPEHIRSTWYITDEDPALNGNLVVKLTPLVNKHLLKFPMTVIDTDYKNYLVFFICKSIGPIDLNVGYIMTRKTTFNTNEIDAIDKKVNAALKKDKVQRDKFTVASQKKCASVKFPLYTLHL